ncbi:hypothetical protein Trydic_g19793 [Trypoxylus dichotomus]
MYEPVELIHADVCGPMEVQSIVYFLRMKDETFEKFQQFKSLVENQTEKKIKVFRSDNETEFCSAEVEDDTTSVGETTETTSEVQEELINSSETSSTIDDGGDEEYLSEQEEINIVDSVR